MAVDVVPAVLPAWWATISLLIAFITLLIVALVHMLSISFGLPSVTLWAKSEYAQILATVIIVVFAYVMVSAGERVVGEVTAAVAKASGHAKLTEVSAAYVDNPSLIAREYIRQGPIECEKWAYWLIFGKNAIPEVASSVSFSVGNVEGVSGAYLFSGYVSAAHYLAQNLAYLSLFHYIQFSILQISRYTMLQIFLPLGLILRAFPITRGAGGLVIGFALGMAFVFPSTYVLIMAMMPSTDYICSQQIILKAQTPILDDEDPCFNNPASVMAAVYEKKTNQDIEKTYSDLMHALGQFYQQALFYPMIALIITFTFIRQTSSLFGADLAEIGRGLIKII